METKHSQGCTGNFAALIERRAAENPARTALTIPYSDRAGWQERELSFGELWRRVQIARRGLSRAGLGRGKRVILLSRLSPDFYVVTIAMVASGLAVTLINTGMGLRRALQAARTARPSAAIAEPRFRWLAQLLPPLSSLPCHRLRDIVDCPDGPLADTPVACQPDAEALITFTSGTTGRPKGANRTHGLLIAQHKALARAFPFEPGDVDMPAFPVLALHNLCCGVSTVFPAMHLTRPGEVEVEADRVLEQIERHRAARLSGAPAYMKRLREAARREPARVRSVRSIGIGGAPVTPGLCRAVREAFPLAAAHVIYGSTEAEPIASVPVSQATGAPSHAEGLLVGRPVYPARVAVVSLPSPPPRLDERGLGPYETPIGVSGEIVVSGPHVVRSYVSDPAADQAHKLFAASGEVWHRTGDTGYRDPGGSLWLTGRVPDLVRRDGEEVHPLGLEAELCALPGVRRAALIAHSRAPQGEVVIETESGADRRSVRAAARTLLAAQGLDTLRVGFTGSVPVDRRHQSKIDRVALRQRRSRRLDLALRTWIRTTYQIDRRRFRHGA